MRRGSIFVFDGGFLLLFCFILLCYLFVVTGLLGCDWWFMGAVATAVVVWFNFCLVDRPEKVVLCFFSGGRAYAVVNCRIDLPCGGELFLLLYYICLCSAVSASVLVGGYVLVSGVWSGGHVGMLCV